MVVLPFDSTVCFFQEPLITRHMVKILVTVLIVRLANTVQAKEMKFGQMTVHVDITALVELIMLLLMIRSLESSVPQGKDVFATCFCVIVSQSNLSLWMPL